MRTKKSGRGASLARSFLRKPSNDPIPWRRFAVRFDSRRTVDHELGTCRHALAASNPTPQYHSAPSAPRSNELNILRRLDCEPAAVRLSRWRMVWQHSTPTRRLGCQRWCILVYREQSDIVQSQAKASVIASPFLCSVIFISAKLSVAATCVGPAVGSNKGHCGGRSG
ncbi:hypothetical protein BDV10DRAFT_34602 [Aspergillus recurvatus]